MLLEALTGVEPHPDFGSDVSGGDDLEDMGTHRHTLDDGTKIVLPTAKLSNTQVEMYLRCPRQYEIRYVLGHKQMPGWVLTEGNATHGALEFNNLHKIKTGADLPTDEVFTRFADELVTREKQDQPVDDNGKRVTGDDIDESIKVTGKAVRAYMDDVAPTMAPVTAERELDFKVAGIPFIGYSDMETKGRIWDYKTTGPGSKKLQAPFVDGSLQFTYYSMATGQQNVGVIGLIRGNPPKTGKNAGKRVRVLRSVRTKEQIVRATAITRSVAESISKGSFPLCSTDNFLCQAKYCGYYPCWKREFKPLKPQKSQRRVKLATVRDTPPPRRRKKA